MAVFWLISSALLADLYRDYCEELDDADRECNDTDERFIATPVLGFVAMVGWVSVKQIISTYHVNVSVLIGCNCFYQSHPCDYWLNKLLAIKFVYISLPLYMVTSFFFLYVSTYMN